MSTTTTHHQPVVSYRAQFARRLTREKLFREFTALSRRAPGGDPGRSFLGAPGSGGFRPPTSPFDLPREDEIPHDTRPPPPGKRFRAAPGAQEPKFCIVGAGVAGLFLAMILSELKIPYDLLESSDRVGGRMYTKHFSDIHPDSSKQFPNVDAKHDYYDIGAMRYPKIPLMDKVFELFRILDIPLIPYWLSGPNTPSLYNDVLAPLESEPAVNGVNPDTFKISETNGGVVPDQAVADGVDAIVNSIYGPFKRALKKNFDTGFDILMKFDQVSTREYMRDRLNPVEYAPIFHTIQWLETNDTSSGLYDQAFSESVIDSLDFDYADGVEWNCIDGGTSKVTDAMLPKLTTPPTRNSPVTRIALVRDPTNESQTHMEVSFTTPTGKKETRKYDTVFNTTTLGCAQRMDLSDAELHPAQKDAIRALHYDASCKVGIKFRTPWWITKCGINKGGVASSDLPIRTCVYPSYNVDDNPTEPAVLLASYTWAQDAQRIGTLIQPESPKGEEQLLELVLRDLVRLHSNTPGITYEFLKKQYITHHAWDWYRDQHTAGAFALFGPGQFSHLYPYLTRPAADGKLQFVGEASSAHHAWIVGALESAQRAVMYSLLRFGRRDLAEDVERKWGPVQEVELGVDGTAHLQVLMGCLRPEEIIEVESKCGPASAFYLRSG